MYNTSEDEWLSCQVVAVRAADGAMQVNVVEYHWFPVDEQLSQFRRNRFGVGEDVEYYAGVLGRWVKARVVAVRDDDGALRLGASSGGQDYDDLAAVAPWWLRVAEQDATLRYPQDDDYDLEQVVSDSSAFEFFQRGDLLQRRCEDGSWRDCTVVDVREDMAIEVDVEKGHWFSLDEQEDEFRRNKYDESDIVEYNSATQGYYIRAKVNNVRQEDGAIQLSVKRGYWFPVADQISKMRHAGKMLKLGEPVYYNSVTNGKWIAVKVAEVNPEDGAVQISLKSDCWFSLDKQSQQLRRNRFELGQEVKHRLTSHSHWTQAEVIAVRALDGAVMVDARDGIWLSLQEQDVCLRGGMEQGLRSPALQPSAIAIYVEGDQDYEVDDEGPYSSGASGSGHSMQRSASAPARMGAKRLGAPPEEQSEESHEEAQVAQPSRAASSSENPFALPRPLSRPPLPPNRGAELAASAASSSQGEEDSSVVTAISAAASENGGGGRGAASSSAAPANQDRPESRSLAHRRTPYFGEANNLLAAMPAAADIGPQSDEVCSSACSTLSLQAPKEPPAEDQADCLLRRAETLHKLGRLEEAEGLYREVLEIRPASVSAFCGLGQLLRDQGDLDGAEEALRVALDLAPLDAPALTALAALLAERGDAEAAEAVRRKAEQAECTPAKRRSMTLKDHMDLVDSEVDTQTPIGDSPSDTPGSWNNEEAGAHVEDGRFGVAAPLAQVKAHIGDEHVVEVEEDKRRFVTFGVPESTTSQIIQYKISNDSKSGDGAVGEAPSSAESSSGRSAFSSSISSNSSDEEEDEDHHEASRTRASRKRRTNSEATSLATSNSSSDDDSESEVSGLREASNASSWV